MDELTNIIIPMAGLGKRFHDCGYTLPKPLLPLGNQTMIESVVENLYFDKYLFTFIVNTKQINVTELKTKISKKLKSYNVVEIDYLPQGPAASSILGIPIIDTTRPLIITNCDQIIDDFNVPFFDTFCKRNEVDGVLGVFHSSSPKNSYVRVNDVNEIIEIKEKEIISNIATNGFHYWTKGDYFVDSFNQMKQNNDLKNGEYYVAPTYNYMIQKGMRVLPYYFNMHYPIGIPKDYESYKSMKNI